MMRSFLLYSIVYFAEAVTLSPGTAMVDTDGERRGGDGSGRGRCGLAMVLRGATQARLSLLNGTTNVRR